MKFTRARLEVERYKQNPRDVRNIERHGWFWFDSPPVLGDDFLRTMSDLTFYIYSRHDHRTYRLPFNEAQVESEFKDPSSAAARETDEIVLKWEISKTDIPFKYASSLTTSTMRWTTTTTGLLASGAWKMKKYSPTPASATT